MPLTQAQSEELATDYTDFTEYLFPQSGLFALKSV
jgi:hypothetical protein